MLYLDPEFSGEVVVSWIVLVAVEIILMFIVLFLSVCRCTSRNGEANIGVVLTISLAWTLIALIGIYIEGVAFYIGLGIWFAISTFATLGLHYHLLNLFCAGTVITGVSLIPACVMLLASSIMYCSQSKPAPPQTLAIVTPGVTTMTAVTVQPSVPMQQMPPPGYTPVPIGGYAMATGYVPVPAMGAGQQFVQPNTFSGPQMANYEYKPLA